MEATTPSSQREARRVEPFALTLLEAAQYASVTPWFIQTAVWSGALPARRAGKRSIILREDLQNFLRGLPVVEPRRPKQPKLLVVAGNAACQKTGVH